MDWLATEVTYIFRDLDLEFRPAALRLCHKQLPAEIRLGEKQAILLTILLEQCKNNAVTFKFLKSEIWPDEDIWDEDLTGRIESLVTELKKRLPPELRTQLRSKQKRLSFIRCDERISVSPEPADQMQSRAVQAAAKIAGYEQGLAAHGSEDEAARRAEWEEFVYQQVWTTFERALPLILERSFQLIWGQMKTSKFFPPLNRAVKFLGLYEMTIDYDPVKPISRVIREAVREALQDCRGQIRNKDRDSQ